MSNTDTNEVKIKLSTNVKVISTCERVVEITVPQNEVERYCREQYNEIESHAQIPGFRPGKAPRSLIEKKFKREVKDHVKRSIISDAIQSINDDIDFVPISEPKLDIDSCDIPDNGPFVFDFSIEVRPEFNLPEWKGLYIEKPVRDIKAEDIDREIITILAEHGTLLPINKPAAKGNYIDVNITAKLNDNVINYRENDVICIKKDLLFQDCVIKDFDKLAEGVKEGDKISTQITISEFAKNNNARGQNVDITFEVIGVKQIELPEISTELLKQLGSFNDEADFRDSVLNNLKERIACEQNSKIRQQITNLLAKSSEAADWQLPTEFLERQAEREFKRIEYELTSSGYSPEYIASQENMLRQNANEATAKALKEHFILESIAESEKITDTEEDYNYEIESLGKQYGFSPRKMRAYIEKNGQMDILRNKIIEKKVLHLVAQYANFEEIPFDFEVLDAEALKWSITGGDNEINKATAEDLKAVHKEFEYKKKIDPNTRIN
ncbi:MAG: trigger factor [Planctomycetaceae bacterium]|jgi:trigger factor|nr:trigger factor [Planctomycetaceae bacterium]